MIHQQVVAQQKKERELRQQKLGQHRASMHTSYMRKRPRNNVFPRDPATDRKGIDELLPWDDSDLGGGPGSSELV